MKQDMLRGRTCYISVMGILYDSLSLFSVCTWSMSAIIKLFLKEKKDATISLIKSLCSKLFIFHGLTDIAYYRN